MLMQSSPIRSAANYCVVSDAIDASTFDASEHSSNPLNNIIPNVVHDLRNILATLNAGVRLLGASVGQERREMVLAGMGQALSTATRLTNSLFDVAAYDGRRAHGFDLAGRLINIVTLFEPAVPAKVKLTADIQTGLKPIVAGPADLDRAVLNLLMNACEAMPSGGRLIVRARNHGAERVRVIVADTGCGMTRDLSLRLGASRLTTKAEPGHGLGMAQVRRFARESGGRFLLRSAVNRWTVAIMEVPAGSVPPSAVLDAAAEGDVR